MNPDLMNIYVERILMEVGELTKTKLLLETQLRWTQEINFQQAQKLEENNHLLSELVQRVADLEASKMVELKTINKKTKKEVDTSDF